MRARALTTRWAVEDGRLGASFIPRWTVSHSFLVVSGYGLLTTSPGNTQPDQNSWPVHGRWSAYIYLFWRAKPFG